MKDETIPVTGNGKPVRRSNVPSADVDFGSVITKVNTAWTANTWLTLRWTTKADFTTKSTAFNATLSTRKQTGASRPQITSALKILDATIDTSLAYVKGYIVEKYKKEAAPGYYPAFGIVHKSNAYIFPKDQNTRSASLQLMITAIAANGFGTKEYGTTFWTNIKTQYDALLNSASTTDSTVSTKVGDKKVLKTDLKKVLNSLILAIKANYPDTYQNELRSWGFQKEKY